MKTTLDANAKIVLHNINQLKARRTTYMSIGTIIGLICGLVTGLILVFALGVNQRWIGLGPIGMVLGTVAGGLAGRIRQKDLNAITSTLHPASGDSDTNNEAANKQMQAIAAKRGSA